MPAVPLLGPVPIKAGRCILNPKPDRCFACTPIYEHERQWIPKSIPGMARNLVLCFDGTGDSFDKDNSNVVQFLAMLKKDDPEKQLVYYQAGIGTYTVSVVKTPFLEAASKCLDIMFGSSLPEHVKEGYLFLMQNYRAGDKICIFGFSRGAYTARALAGMLQKVGLLPPSNLEQLPFAYAMYKEKNKDGDSLSIGFKRAFSIDVRITFLGVWDTVGSVGLVPKHLPFSGSNNAILHFRHALALDEHRVKFIPFFSTTQIPNYKRTDSKVSETVSENTRHTIERQVSEEAQFEDELNKIAGPVTDVKEVFFAGAHSDVGGGSVKNGERHSLARIPLRWMIRECFNLKIGIIFDEHMLKNEVGLDIETLSKALDSMTLDPTPLDPTVPGSTPPLSRPPKRLLPGTRHLARPDRTALSRNPPKTAITLKQRWQKSVTGFTTEGEAQEELDDTLSPIYDQFKAGLFWKILWKGVDWFPFWVIKKPHAELEGTDDFGSYQLIWNRKKGRIVHHWVMERGMKVHRSVRTRMLAEPMEGDDKRYRPKIRCLIGDKVRRPKRDEWLQEEFDFEWVD